MKTIKQLPFKVSKKTEKKKQNVNRVLMKLLANPFMTICSVEHDIYTLTSVFILSILFSIHFPGC